MENEELIRLKARIVDEIYENTKNQLLVVSREEEELLVNLVLSRANLIEQLNEVSLKLKDIELSSELKELDNISKLKLKEIVETDAEILKATQSLEKGIFDKLKGMKKARNVVTKGYMNYAGSEQQPAYYIDKKK